MRPLHLAIVLILVSTSVMTSTAQQPAEFSLVGQISDYIYGFDRVGDYIYFADYSKRTLSTTSVTDIANNASGVLSQFQTSSSEFAYDVVQSGEYLYFVTIAGQGGRLYVLDIADRGEPALVSTTDLSYAAWELEIYRSHLYILSEFYVMVVDISDPSNPVERDSILQLTNPIEIGFYGGMMIVTDEYHGFTVLDLENPDQPEVITSYRHEGSRRFSDSDIQGNQLYLSSGGVGTLEFDINADGQYTQRDTVLDAIDYGGYCIAIRSDILAVCNAQLEFFDITGDMPKLLGSVDTRYVEELELTADYLILAAGTNGLQIYTHSFDITQTAAETTESFLHVSVLPMIAIFCTSMYQSRKVTTGLSRDHITDS